MRLLAKDPSERPESAADVLQALEASAPAGAAAAHKEEQGSRAALAGCVFGGRHRGRDHPKAACADLRAGPRELGTDPGTGETVTLRKGPYGVYLQRGEPKGPKGKEKPPRVSLPKGLAPAEITLDMALALLALPRSVGAHPETGQPITAGIGRYGPYVKHESTYRNIPDPEDVLTIGLNRAVTLIAEATARHGSSAGKEIGSHPDNGKPVTLHSGRYGPYGKHGQTIARYIKDDVRSYIIPLSADEAGQ